MEISQQIRAGLPLIILPPIDVAVIGVDLDNVSEEELAAYQEYCDEFIKRTMLNTQRLYKQDRDRAVAERDAAIAAIPDGQPVPARLQQPIPGIGPAMARTRYPYDDDGSEDVVSLDRDDNVVIVDAGTR